MFEVLLAGSLLLITHFGISSTSARDVLVGKLGEMGYQGLYSVISLVLVVLLVLGFNNAERLDYFWPINPDLYWIPKLTMPIAFVFLVGAFTSPNPTQVGMEEKMADDDPARGMLRITRHPMMWAIVIFSLGHIAANGDTVAVAFFSVFLLLAGLGTLFIDAKKARRQADAWPAFAAVTSNVPFVAILGGRNRLVLSELLAPIAIGLVLYVAVFWGHAWLSGVEIFW